MMLNSWPSWVKKRIKYLRECLEDEGEGAKINDESLLAFDRFFTTVVPGRRCSITLTPDNDIACNWLCGLNGFSIVFSGVLNQAVSRQSTGGIQSEATHGVGTHSDGIGAESEDGREWGL
jgi:hypothetical protein